MKHPMRVGGPFVRIKLCRFCNRFYVKKFWFTHGCEARLENLRDSENQGCQSLT
jgi:hypothetical protein